MAKASFLLIGPFAQAVTMAGLSLNGPLLDEALPIVEQAGVLVHDGKIVKLEAFAHLLKEAEEQLYSVQWIEEPMVLLPGLIDAHTHLCFAGSRAKDYALRIAGKTYLEIARSGGGILDTVRKTRKASQAELEQSLLQRCQRHLQEGVTTCEVKSGYGLTLDDELKMLRAIQNVSQQQPLELVPTCLAAHMVPPEFEDGATYLKHVVEILLPQVKAEGLANRVDIFIEDTAFDEADALSYLKDAQDLGFDITVHADQFSTGGSEVAARVHAASADHLEASGEEEIDIMKEAGVVATVLPGASVGLGMHYAPARKMLDAGLCVAIATDWNPGSAPMGDLLLQAALLSAAQKLTMAETWAGITFRAAHALRLSDRGTLATGQLADMIAFNTDDYQEILYVQGKLKPSKVWKKGILV
ncbi:imidazolonepropionase [Rufibacter sp. DG15C]|uniref:imidazolonepropionase n=1 Tax=Rufibacter sp. DG15C TaxID=1379909 RepID=UPI00078E46FF|nr:imidazolonepropionase [Rufibacter sp. DG15C]AMM51826.1 imidazolonepropionase [Rufibacter sp. DG15C]